MEKRIWKIGSEPWGGHMTNQDKRDYLETIKNEGFVSASCKKLDIDRTGKVHTEINAGDIILVYHPLIAYRIYLIGIAEKRNGSLTFKKRFIVNKIKKRPELKKDYPDGKVTRASIYVKWLKKANGQVYEDIPIKKVTKGNPFTRITTIKEIEEKDIKLIDREEIRKLLCALVKNQYTDEKQLSESLKILDLLNRKKQVILFGPPGTGKTFKVSGYALALLLKDGEKNG
jgi:ACT domain-containing protein